MAVALIVAAGRGERLGSGRPKALVALAGRPMLEWSVDALRAVDAVERIVVALPADALDAAPSGTVAVAGGTVRSESVRNALLAAGDGDPVVVHDAARPLASTELFERALSELEASGADAVVAAAPVSDTIKEVGSDGHTVVRTLERARLWAVQTPQVFRRAALERVLQWRLRGHARDRDRRRLARRAQRGRGAHRALGAGEPQGDNAGRSARRGVAARGARRGGPAMSVRTGLGYDCHQFADGRRLVLGGVEIAHDRGLLGHSDADVLTHAIIDALLGAAALGDIGQHFPDTDERYRDADSLALLRASVALLREHRFTIVNVDATVVIERPQLAPAREQIRARLADALGIGVDEVSVKATRGEGMGFVGREEGAAALAIATVDHA